MKLKLDENLGERGRSQLQHAGHDVATVPEQALTSATDADLIRTCMEEGRSLVTLDLDYANPLRFRPGHYAGIAVLRLPDNRPPPIWHPWSARWPPVWREHRRNPAKARREMVPVGKHGIVLLGDRVVPAGIACGRVGNDESPVSGSHGVPVELAV